MGIRGPRFHCRQYVLIVPGLAPSRAIGACEYRCMQVVDTVAASADVPVFRCSNKYSTCMQLGYRYRRYPSPWQQRALAQAFGCARVVFNDALAARRDAREAGLPYLTDADLSARLTAAKKTPERAWLGEVSSVVLQQAL